MMQTDMANEKGLDALVELMLSKLDQFLDCRHDCRHTEEIKWLAGRMKRIPSEHKTLQEHMLQWHSMWGWYFFISNNVAGCRSLYVDCKHFLAPIIRKLQLYAQSLLVALLEKMLGSNDPLVATSLQKLAQSYYEPKPGWLRPSNEEFAKAEFLLKQSLTIKFRGKPEEANELYKRADEIASRNKKKRCAWFEDEVERAYRQI